MIKGLLLIRPKCPKCGNKLVDVNQELSKTLEKPLKTLFYKKNMDGLLYECKNKNCDLFDHRLMKGVHL